MARTVVNDRGERVLAVGEPGSLERVKVEYPCRIQGVRHVLSLGLCPTPTDDEIDVWALLIRNGGGLDLTSARLIVQAAMEQK